jgi:hypothetical protein
MRRAIVVAAAVFLSCGVAAESFGQNGMRWRGGGGWGPGTSYGRIFDPATVETIRGEVVSVDLITPRKGMTSGVHLVVKTEEGPLSVHLGPEWYVSRQETRIETNDTVEVKGSRVVFKGEPAMVAAELKKGDETLVLRDGRGVPVWSGWRRRR